MKALIIAALIAVPLSAEARNKKPPKEKPATKIDLAVTNSQSAGIVSTRADNRLEQGNAQSVTFERAERISASAPDLYTSFECQDFAATGQGVVGGGAIAAASEACLVLREGLAILDAGLKTDSRTLMAVGVGMVDEATRIRHGRVHSLANRCLGVVPKLTETAPGSGDTPLDYRWWKRCVLESLSLGLLDFAPKGDLAAAFIEERMLKEEGAEAIQGNGTWHWEPGAVLTPSVVPEYDIEREEPK